MGQLRIFSYTCHQPRHPVYGLRVHKEVSEAVHKYSVVEIVEK